MSQMDHVNEIAKRKSGGSPEWEAFRWECISNDGMLVQGGIPSIITRGQRKGQKTWRRENMTPKVVVVLSEINAEWERYESITGNCGECMGKGMVLKGWNAIDGTTFRECPRCKGTGKATLKAVA